MLIMSEQETLKAVASGMVTAGRQRLNEECRKNQPCSAMG